MSDILEAATNPTPEAREVMGALSIKQVLRCAGELVDAVNKNDHEDVSKHLSELTLFVLQMHVLQLIEGQMEEVEAEEEEEKLPSRPQHPGPYL